MTTRLMRGLALVAAIAALIALSGCGGSDVTRARLERSLPATFANLYVQQAHILGEKNISVRSLAARAQCDKGGPKVADHGPGADWICQMYWHDPAVALPDGSGKFELNVHSNNCYTAGGPSKYVGPLMITDTHGKDVPNPVFEFDSCFDPSSSDAPTNVSLSAPPSPPPGTAAAPSSAALTLPAGVLKPDAQGNVTPQLSCGSGAGGCAGTLVARFGGRTVATRTFALAPGATGTERLALTPAERSTGGSLTLTVKPVIGDVTHNFASLTVPRG